MENEDIAATPETAVPTEAVTPEVVQDTQDVAQEGTGGTEESQGEKLSRNQRRKAQADRLRQEAEQAKAALEASQARVRQLEQMAQGEAINEADFATFEDYQAALSARAAMKMMDDRAKQEAMREAQSHEQRMQQLTAAQQEEVNQQWVAQAQDAAARYADFEQVVGNPRLNITPQVADMIKDMDQGADVAYQLGLNPELANQISSMPPLQAAMHLGSIQARLARPAPRTVTTAPDPINPVKATGTASKAPAKMTMAEYRAAREAGKL